MVIHYIKNKVLNNKFILLLIIIPILIFFIPIELVEEKPVICLSRLILNKECIGCGMTRACISLIHFKFDKALKYNRLVIIVFPLLSYNYLKLFFNTLKK